MREFAGRVGKHVPLLIVIAVLLFLFIIRLRIADVPLERDEGEYAYSGQLILQGFPPYELAYNMKFPGTYYAYSVILAAFGQTAWGVHAGLAVINAATIVLLYFLSLRVLNDATAAVISAVAFGVVSVDRWIMGVFGHATHFVVLTAVAGFLVLFHALDSRKAFTFAAAGGLFGLSVLMKQNGIFFFVLGAGIAVWSAVRKTHDLRCALRNLVLFVAGAAIPFVAACFVLFRQGVFGRFWFWTFQYTKEYVSLVSPSDAFGVFARNFAGIIQADRLIWTLAAAGVVLLWVAHWPSEVRFFLTALLITSLIAISPGFYFREHYFILLLPSMALFCGVAVISIEHLLNRVTSTKTARIVATTVFVVAVAAYVRNDSYFLFSMPGRELSRAQYGANPFVEAPELARYVRAHTDSRDRIAVLGSEPEIYFYANRKSATGYIYTYGLMEQQKYSHKMQDEMITEITAAHPKYVLFVAISTSWNAQSPTEKIITWSEAYLSKCYVRIGIAEIKPDNTTRWFWDADLPKYQPESPFALYLFKTKTDEPCAAPN